MRLISIATLIKSVVPISRFNKGEANKIFDEVNRDGVKVVMKNNDPACILVSPTRYLEMEELLENYRLAEEAARRELAVSPTQTISHNKLLEELNINADELNSADIDLD